MSTQHVEQGGWEYNWIGEFGEQDNFRWDSSNSTGQKFEYDKLTDKMKKGISMRCTDFVIDKCFCLLWPALLSVLRASADKHRLALLH